MDVLPIFKLVCRTKFLFCKGSSYILVVHSTRGGGGGCADVKKLVNMLLQLLALRIIASTSIILLLCVFLPSHLAANPLDHVRNSL